MIEELKTEADGQTNLLQIEKKLKFADYLLQRGSAEFLPGAMKHLLNAANKAVSLHLGLDGTNINHLLIGKKLFEGGDEEKKFSGSYLQLWKLAIRPNPALNEALDALTHVKAFVQFVKSNGR